MSSGEFSQDRRPRKPEVQDDFAMSTNSSSIVSKRSVERLYYPDQPPFFRFFVKKFQRRSPLINRGYFLRLHVIDVLIHRFLQRPSSRTKVVINLGCGSDVLPWQCWSRYPELCQGVKFVDVDFPSLIAQKRQVVTGTPELLAPLTRLELSDDSPLMLQSDTYCQIGCDLCSLGVLEDTLSQVTTIANVDFLFIAEVSITYMDTKSADALIQWAASMNFAEFCLLEQILPDSALHPFAETMIQNFEKLRTPLKSVSQYPSKESQRARFRAAGWPIVRSWTLWQAWADDFFVTLAERRRLDRVEPFDEWEEFALFASHHIVISSTNISETRSLEVAESETTIEEEVVGIPIDITFEQFPPNGGRRAFGAPLIMESDIGQQFVANFLGCGTKEPMRSYDVFRPAGQEPLDMTLQSSGPSTRMCHSITDMGTSGYLLCGGRISPGRGLADAWVFKRDSNQWFGTFGLPVPLYRHAVTRLGKTSMALLVGGKHDNSRIFHGCLLYHPKKGWLHCRVTGDLKPVFGAVLACHGTKMTGSSDFVGILSGGLTIDGTMANQLLAWELDVADVENPTIRFVPCDVSRRRAGQVAGRLDLFLSRFGAMSCQMGPWLLILGGIIAGQLLPQACDILVCRMREPTVLDIVYVLHDARLLGTREIPRPLLVGSSVIACPAGHVVIAGGGAMCFSMGTFWTKGSYTFKLPSIFDDRPASAPVPLLKPTPGAIGWKLWRTQDITCDVTYDSERLAVDGALGAPRVSTVPRVKLESEDEFRRILQAGQPVVFEGSDIGLCVTKWDFDYLVNAVGSDREVVVHEMESTTPNMTFRSKNFRYTSKTFPGFLKEVTSGGRLYMRAISTGEPANKPASLQKDFPALSSDFSLPPQLGLVADEGTYFSSVLRISGSVNMWLHYDVMANVYCQVRGTRRFLLFPPSDLTRLPFSPGASSSDFDVFSSNVSPTMSALHPYEAVVSPGNILLIPRFWLHAAESASPWSIAVNVFFRDLERGYSHGRDVYGNRDLAAYEKARQDIGKIVSSFQDLPPDARRFYMARLADELLEQARQ